MRKPTREEFDLLIESLLLSRDSIFMFGGREYYVGILDDLIENLYKTVEVSNG